MSRKPLDVEDPQQPYQQVAASIRVAITSGSIPVGDQLSSVRDLAGEYGVSTGTVQQALRVLREDGLITTWQGRGTFVRSRQPVPARSQQSDVAAIMRRLDEMLDRLEQLEEQVEALRKGTKKPRPSAR
ncbi:GntR family transcriptional regulator [Actinopolymorpha sp. B17G11]|uniref:GntR family transcriptional regulator n=1 Tax=Actinopolymorpha sp. B17G11 TaxID=3160861 RepID=UPI0032E46639